jgi:methionine-S-sulfoxide reductase
MPGITSALLSLLLSMPSAGAEGATVTTTTPTAQAVLGGGCFWCLEAVYEDVPGVLDVTSGYAGGLTDDPSYERVITGRTGHAEVVRVTFDPSAVTYEKLLEIFWVIHDPTTPNRQGNDVGSQYRSIILFQDEQQERIARASIATGDPSPPNWSPSSASGPRRTTTRTTSAGTPTSPTAPSWWPPRS